MSTEQERLEKAKQKLMNMNRKVLHAQNISKKRNTKKPELEPMSPAPQQKPAASNTYLFELTESMLADSFSEEEVTKYVKKVEAESKCTDLELDQHEIAISAEIKKINRAIRKIKDPKPAAGDSPRSEKAEKEPDPKENEIQQNQQPGYAQIQQLRGGGTSEKQEKESQEALPTAKKAPVTPMPKKSKLPTRKKTADPPETPTIQATGAGAKFLADLMNDVDDGDPPF